jgi:hypothetical protein
MFVCLFVCLFVGWLMHTQFKGVSSAFLNLRGRKCGHPTSNNGVERSLEASLGDLQ